MHQSAATVAASNQQQRRGRQKSIYFPPQHGAWAFLGLPILLGLTQAEFSPLTVLVSLGFVVAYPASYFAIAVMRYPRPQRYRNGLITWGLAGIAIAIVAVVARPWLLWAGVVYGVLFAVNLAYAKAHNERSLINDAIFIVECLIIIPILWGISATAGSLTPPAFTQAPTEVWTVTGFAAMALVGSTLHVRSLIRERRNHNFRRYSQVFAVVCVPVAMALAYPYGVTATTVTAVAFALLAVRSFLIGRRPLKPGIIGVFELVGFIAVFAAGMAV